MSGFVTVVNAEVGASREDMNALERWDSPLGGPLGFRVGSALEYCGGVEGEV